MNRMLRILIVEDSEDASRTLQTALEIQGHQVCVAADALVALDEAEKHVFDAAVIDIGLPGMDGRSLARLFRSSPDHCGMCLVALSGRNSTEDVNLSRQAGFDAHLAKPVTTVYLLNVITGRLAVQEQARAAPAFPAVEIAEPGAKAPAAAAARGGFMPYIEIRH